MLNTSKIQFKSNSQQARLHSPAKGCCAQYFKDTIQKQFTTHGKLVFVNCLLCSILQRYNSKAIHNAFICGGLLSLVVLNTSKIQFKSNSQQIFLHSDHKVCCAQYFKDTIQKQFTTVHPLPLSKLVLCSILQRYNSKAIHNELAMVSFQAVVVLNTSKIQFKSNSQLAVGATLNPSGCAQYFKDTIQKQFTTRQTTSDEKLKLCSILQRYNSKAIHNNCVTVKQLCFVVLNTSKIQFKSNSQLPGVSGNWGNSCAQYFKDTIQKQFTTELW